MIWGKLSKNFRVCGVKNELGSPWHKVFDPHAQEISHVGRNEYPTCHTKILLQIIQYPCLPASFCHFTGQDGALQVLQSAEAHLSSSWGRVTVQHGTSLPILLGLLPIPFPQPTASRSPPPLICSRLTKIYRIFKGSPFWANPSLLDN